MKERINFIAVLLIVAVALAFTMCKQEVTPPSTGSTDIVTIGKVDAKGSMAAVKMSHAKHEGAGVKCAVCHHKKGNDDRIKKCSQCHKGAGADKLMHKACVDCHKQKAKGPTGCADCHK